MQRIRAWVDPGNPEMTMSRRTASLMGLAVQCDDKKCTAAPPTEIVIGEMRIPLDAVKEVQIPLKPVNAAAVMAPGLAADINIPSTVLRHYDVLVSFPDKQFTIGLPGSIPFNGVKEKVLVNPQNGLIQVPSRIENKNYNLALDFGSSISFLSPELFDKLSSMHTEWPHMTGSVGPANMWGKDDETKSKLMRIDRLQYGPLFLTDIPFVEFSSERGAYFEKRAGTATAGLLGAQALLNHRVGLDYARSAVYFEAGRTFRFPDFDVVGLILRPEDNGNFSVIGVADMDGKPSVPEVAPGYRLLAVDITSTTGLSMGQVWALLRGTPGQARRLTVERAGKTLTIDAPIQHFLAIQPEEENPKKKKK